MEHWVLDPAVITAVGASWEAIVRIARSGSGRRTRRRIVARTFRFHRAGTVVEYRYRAAREDVWEDER